METIGQRLRRLRLTKTELSIEGVARIINVGFSSVAKYERDEQTPPPDKLVSLADIYDVSVDYILGRTDVEALAELDLETHPVSDDVIYLPVVSQVSAGKPRFAETDILDTQWVEADTVRGGEFFWMRVDGDSMSPRIQPGDLVLVRRQPDFIDGEVIVADIEDEGIALKRAYRTNDHLVLTSDNGAYRPMNIPLRKARVIGKMKLFQGQA